MAINPPKFNMAQLRLIIFLEKLGIKSANPKQLARDLKEKNGN